MNAEWLRARGIVAAAVGAGILLGAAGILLYQQLLAEKKRLDRIASSVSLLRRDLDHLKRCRAAVCPSCMHKLDTNHTDDVKPPGSSRSRSEARSMSDMDMFSTVSRFNEEDEDSEFFDLSDEEGDRVDVTSVGAAGDSEEALGSLLIQVDTLLTGGTCDEKNLAYQLLHEHKAKYRSSVPLLWRLAKAAHSMGSIMGPEMKKEYLFEGLEHAKAALALDDKDADAHKWFAITLGSCGDFLPLKEKISNGYIFKQHVDTAIGLRPLDYTLYHLQGRFEFEVASLSWIERKLAANLIAAPPEGSYEKARSYFETAEELSPKEWKENRLFLAKCHVQLNQIAQALQWLDHASTAPCTTPEDADTDKEVQVLLAKYKSYRS